MFCLAQHNQTWQQIDFNNAKLKSIKADFTKLQNLHVLEFLNNTCMSAEYGKKVTLLQDLPNTLLMSVVVEIAFSIKSIDSTKGNAYLEPSEYVKHRHQGVNCGRFILAAFCVII